MDKTNVLLVALPIEEEEPLQSTTMTEQLLPLLPPTTSTTTTGEQPPPSTPTEPVVDSSHPPQLPENYESDPSYKKLPDGSIVRDDNKYVSSSLFGEVPREKDISTTTWVPDKNGEMPDTVTKITKTMRLDQKNDWQKYSGPKLKWTPADKDGSKWIYTSEDPTIPADKDGPNLSYTSEGPVYTRHPDLRARVYTVEPDGTTTYEYRDGRTQTVLPDKTLIEKVPTLDPDSGFFAGQFIVTTTNPDKTKTVKDPDGKETFLDTNGNTQKIVFPQKDGTFNVYDPNAGTTVNTNTKPGR